MVKQEASLEGRGGEILLGGESGGTSPSESTPAETTSPPKVEEQPEEPAGEGGMALAEEWAAMLEEEALAATGDVESAEEPEFVSSEEPESVAETPVRPAVEEVEGALGAELDEGLPPLATTPAQPAEVATQPGTPAPAVVGGLPPLATTPAQPAELPSQPTAAVTTSMPGAVPEMPPAPTYTEPTVPVGEATAPLPPPKEKPEATDAIVRARLSGMLYETPTEKPPEERLRPEGPETAELIVEEIVEYEGGQPSRIRQEREVLAYVGLKQRQDLWNEISELYRVVPDVLSTDEKQPRALRLLQEAQDILLEKPRQFDVAKYKVGQVRGLVNRRLNISRWSNTYGWGAFVYESLWIIALVWGIFFASNVINWIVTTTQGVQNMDSGTLLVLWNTMMWGSLGGVIGAFYSLYWHVAKVKDFDKQYMLWYIVQPVIGLLLGGLVHLLIGSGFITARGETASGAEVAVSFFPYAVACIAGFRQRFILEMIDRIIQLLTPSPPREESSAEEEAPEEISSASA